MSLSEAALALLSILVIIDPIALVPVFAALTAGRPEVEVRRIAARGTLAGFALLAIAGLVGHAALTALGADAPLIHLIGGGALVAIGAAMLFGGGIAPAAAAGPRRDPTFVPLAVPLIAGPGALGAMIVLTARHAGHPAALGELYAILALVAVITLVALRAAGPIACRIGPRGQRAVVRILGLVLVLVAARFFYEGLTALGIPGRRPA